MPNRGSRHTLLFVETPNVSQYQWEPDPDNPAKMKPVMAQPAQWRCTAHVPMAAAGYRFTLLHPVSMSAVAIEDSALAKALAHATKHLSCSVVGLFVGTRRLSGVVVQDTLPLFHRSLLRPMFEVGWTGTRPPSRPALYGLLLDAPGACVCVSSKDPLQREKREVVGVYFVNARVEDHEVPAALASVASEIFEEDPNIRIFAVCLPAWAADHALIAGR